MKFGYPTTILSQCHRSGSSLLFLACISTCVLCNGGNRVVSVRVSGSTLLVVSAVTSEVDRILMFDHCVYARVEEDFDISVLAPANLIE